MKTPDANKCGLECIRTNVERICVKPEKGQCPRCEQLVGESLDHIQQLEANWSQVSKALCGKENATLDEVLRAVSQVKADLEAVKQERDAVLNHPSIRNCDHCEWCKCDEDDYCWQREPCASCDDNFSKFKLFPFCQENTEVQEDV